MARRPSKTQESQAAAAALEMVLEASAGPRQRTKLRDDRAARRIRSQLRRWHRSGEILGYGVGRKQVDGLSTNRTALQIYVRSKRPRDLLPASTIIPPTLGWLGLPAPALIDVIEIAPFRLAVLDREQRPIFPGLSSGHCITGETGSLGAVVRALGDTNGRFLLSAAHVFAASGRAAVGDVIIQPGGLDGGRCPRQTIGTLARFVTFRQGSGFPNVADVALARLDSAVGNVPGGLPIQRLATPSSVRVDDVLFRIGCRTGERSVQVRSLSFATTLEYPTPTGGRANFGFRNLILYTDFSLQGDSGGPVLTRSGDLVGIHVARSNDGFGLAVPVWSLPPDWNVTV